MSTDEIAPEWVHVGKLNGLFGVKGWVKIFSNTQPKENILNYSPLFLKREGKWQEYKVVAGKLHGKGVIAQFAGCNDRDLAAELIGSEIAIKREQLADTQSNEYYWTDLVGLVVTNTDGIELGKITSMLETGANDVMIVTGVSEEGKKQERLLPFLTDEVVQKVDLESGTMTVEWDADF